MKRLFINMLIVLGFWGSVAQRTTQAQERGKELYELMSKGGLTTTEGNRNINWLPDGSGYYITEVDTLEGTTQYYRVDPESQQTSFLFEKEMQERMLVDYNKMTGKNATGLPFSSFNYVQEGAAIVFSVDKRHFLYDFKAGRLRELRRPEIKPQPGSKGLMRNMAASQLWNGTYSPDYKHFAYVKDYDLYIANTENGIEKRLSQGGNENLLNGRPDWVYPEEFFQLTAYWWSPDSRKLAYYQFDEHEVYKHPFVHELNYKAELELQSYPKTGDTNPTVKLFIVDIETGKNVEIETKSSSDIYIIKPMWLLDGSELTFQKMNRHQNKLELFAANPLTGKVRSILKEKEEYFINWDNDFVLLKDGKHFLWSSERSGWRHIYLYDLQGKLIRQLTSGDWPVGKIIKVDDNNRWVYFTGHRNMGLETHFYRVKLDGSKLMQLTTEPGSHQVSMDPVGKYYTDYYSSFTIPPVMNLHDASGKKLHNLLSTNTDRLNSLKLEKPELVMLKSADGRTDLNGLLFKPAGFDPTKSYPLIVYVYGGPDSKMVRNSYQMSGYLQTLAQLGFMVWKMDNRGTRQRGKKFETEIYLKLGQVELADQTAGVKYITQRPYIDGSIVGVFGGSYGGYMTCMALLKEPEVFHVGVAVAPLTDWRNYDTIYTERYMRTPQENKKGYDLGSTLPYAKNLRGKLLLVHGSIDNNVHPGNTIQLIDALIKAQKRFDLMFYPEQRHGIRGLYGRHYRKLAIDYFVEHLLDISEIAEKK
jgi:dipeptidyl-peptidase-4